MRHIFWGVVLSSPVVMVGQALAFERDHDAHEHGHATLMVVQEKNELQLKFQSPAMNIVGFEHQPSSKEEIKQVQSAKKQLETNAQLIVINSEAQCKLEHLHVSSGLFKEREHHEDDHNSHSDHDDKHHDEHHDEHRGHDSEHKEQEGEVHSEFEVEYHFECDAIEKLKSIELGLINEFASLEELEAQVVTDSVQKMVKLTSAQNRLSL